MGDDFITESEEDALNCQDEDARTTLVIMKECTGGVTGGSFEVALGGDMTDSSRWAVAFHLTHRGRRHRQPDSLGNRPRLRHELSWRLRR